MREFTLNRTGLEDLKFQGILIAEFSNRTEESGEPDRGHEIGIYRTDDDYWVVRISYRTTHPGEANHDDVEVINSAEEIEPLLSLYNPPEHIAIPPRNIPPAINQAEILRGIINRYDLLVSRLLTSMPSLIKAAPGEPSSR